MGNIITIKVTKDPAAFARQKIEKELAKGSMLGVDLSVAEMNEQDLLNHFRQYSLNRLKSFYDGYNSCISVLIGLGKTETSDSQDPLYSRYETRLKTVEQAMEERKADIENVNGRIQTLESEQKEFLYGSSAMAQPLFSYQPHDLKTCLGSLYAEFCKYRREDAYTNNSYTSEGLDTAECLEKAKELLDAAHREAKKACRLQRTASASLHNLFALPEFEPLYDKFALYNYIRIRTEDEVLKLRIAGIEFHGETAHEVQVTFAEHVDVVSSTAQTVRQTLQQAAQMSESYPSTVLQAEKGNQAEQKLQEIETNGLDAGKNMVTNSENNEITITRSGIIGKCMNDEGSYGDRQFRITGNTMAFTDDNWKSVRVAIGENTFRHPLTESKETQYGIFAENIIGNLIAGEKMYIGNKEGNVFITESGIRIGKGTISWDGVNPPGMEDIGGLTEFKHKVNAALTGSPTTEIGSDYVISPKIGGGYLYIKDTKNDTKTSVEINPNGTNFAGHNGSYAFNVSKDGTIIMGVKNDGSGYFRGEIQANSGKIANFNISTDKICTDETEFKDSTGIYFGKDGLRIGDNFKVESDGTMCLKNSLYMWYEDEYENDGGPGYRECFVIGKSADADMLTAKLTTSFESNVFVLGSLSLDQYLTVNEEANFMKSISIKRILELDGDLIAHGVYNNQHDSSTPNLRIGSGHKIKRIAESSRKFKNSIKLVNSDELNPQKLYDINVVQYKFNENYLAKEDQRHGKDVIGFIAEDVYEKYPIAADYSFDKNGAPVVHDWNLRYMVPAMLKLIQEQKQQLFQLDQEVKSLKQ